MVSWLTILQLLVESNKWRQHIAAGSSNGAAESDNAAVAPGRDAEVPDNAAERPDRPLFRFSVALRCVLTHRVVHDIVAYMLASGIYCRNEMSA